VAALARLCAELDGPELTFDATLPALLVDACRFGARPCVAPRGQAAGAILDVDGNVRPCLHGAPLGRADDSLATLLAAQQAAAAQAFARRGCRECAALPSCSRCLFPAPFADENAYCDFMRAHVTTLPRVRRLVETLARLGRRGVTAPLRIRRWPRGAVAAAGESLTGKVAEAWNRREVWLVEPPEQSDAHHLFWLRDGALHDASVEPMAALVGAAIADGETPPLPARVIERMARRLAPLLI
jgi:radical SAM protein with 4Fe4S-binding SPASM domain